MRRYRLYLGLLFVLFVSLSTLAAPATAQSKEVVVMRRDGQITVRQNGDLLIAETWQVRYAGGPFRFAFRAIPLNRLEDITGWRVSEAGQAYREGSSEDPGTFRVEDDGGQRTLTWFFEPTIDRTRSFSIEYTVVGALRIDPGGDQVFWKFVESGRGYSIQTARVVVSLPMSFDSAELTTQAYLGGAETGGSGIRDGRTVEFTGGPFAASDEWEIRVRFPHGATSASPPAWQLREQRIVAWRPIGNLISLALALVIFVGGLLGLYLLWFIRGR